MISLLASSNAVASALAVFVAMFASLLLLAIRAWSSTVGLPLGRRARRLVDASTTLMVVLFLALVVVRFRTLG